ncbi:HAMP domain-containing sensor histidine kinase [Saccharibacillus sp. CPCC 101409]|uniref:sensor histidine kinase n=1 Tax=Saccharibacillus sp. CPCC 101409 TaxID=3058041 RepID=UPI0026735011|nr:HAMP domain-containing sensor histidine kinase [Saccharibacillus sp. CPCC 101409]MDO3408488.1 HAMP domain-containing sensor histidine kinase [Saccharibacillus sp. CPCC 101409]
MKRAMRVLAIWIALLAVVFLCIDAYPKHAKHVSVVQVGSWQFRWDNDRTGEGRDALPEGLANRGGWTEMNADMDPPTRPEGAGVAWVRINVPTLAWPVPALLIEKAYGRSVSVFTEDRKLFDSNRSYSYEANHLLLPLRVEDSGGTIYVRMQSEDRVPGGVQHIAFGDFYGLLSMYLTRDVLDIMLGGSFVLTGFVMMICSAFLDRRYLRSWLSLSGIILSIGMLVVSYSPFLFTLYPQYGGLLQRLFDVALFALLPSFLYFFEALFGRGYKNSLLILCRFQLGYSFFCLLAMLANALTGERYFSVYFFLTTTILGVLMIVELLTVLTYAIIYGIKGNREVLIFNTGLVLFAGTGIFELVRYYATNGDYNLYWWKWGMAAFVVSMIVVFGRRFADTHNQVLKYSKELEMFNNELQRAEKMEIISELAASVAHEVRNPLQVTRGFLQLLGERSAASEKVYIDMALEELDRASGIITDFLTFAKPGLENVKTLAVSEEFRHIEGVLTPLASINGSRIELAIEPELYVKGNSSKFKQAFINMIKNSIEALQEQEQGLIRIRAAAENGEVVIRIRDNGVGMTKQELERLGEPYYSNKIKGTGLGLMVTFRIIEAMQGSLTFESEKGAGTQATVRFPAASP